MDPKDRKPKRRSDGTFDEGSSGNPNGRPEKDDTIPHPFTMRDTHSDVAQFRIASTVQGKRKRLTLMESNMLTLALAGAAGDKAAARDFLNFAHLCAEQELRMMREIVQTHQHGIPAYLMEEDPEVRAEMKRVYDEMWAEATGKRRKTTRGLGRRPPRKSR
jgi:hypothetical protein